MQEKARAEVINILGNEPIIPNSDQLKVLLSHYYNLLIFTFYNFTVFYSYIICVLYITIYIRN
jgi:hypothetical protein